MDIPTIGTIAAYFEGYHGRQQLQMIFSNTRKGFNALQIAALVAVFCVLMFGTWYVACKLNQLNEKALFNHTSTNITRSVDVGIEQARALIASVTALHSSLRNSDSAEISVFLDRLRLQNSFITSIGRFEKDIDNARYPLSHISPAPPISELQVGYDLASIVSLEKLITNSFENNTVSSDRLPTLWPTKGSLLLFSPSFSDQPNGSLLPKGDEIEASADGGYLMALDLAELLSSSPDVASGKTGYRIHLLNELGEQTIVEHELASTDSGFFTLLNQDASSNRKWQLGSSVINVELNTNIGVSPTLKIILGATSLMGTLFFLMFTSMLYERKIAKFERSKNLKSINAEREKAAKTLSAISDSVITLSMQKNILHMNLAAERLLNAQLGDVENYPIQNFFSFTSIDINETHYNIALQLDKLEVGEEQEVDLQISNKGQDGRTIKVSISHTLDSENNAIGYIIVLRDVTNERALTSELEYLANHDSLTGCANRYYFESRLDELLQDIKISRRRHAMCYMDLDQFKVINDTCGHSAGDKLLCELTGHLQRIVRKGDLLARLGGDEFGLIIVDADADDAQQIAEKVYDFFQSYIFQYEDNAFPIRASIGFVQINEHSGLISEIFSAADIALYSAKDGGRNTLSYYSESNESMTNRHQEMSWLPRLNHALQHDRFQLLVQAIAPIGKQQQPAQPAHFEFLLRMLDDDNKEITPYFFIKAAERYELMVQIDRWVLENAMRIISDLPATLTNNCSFSINLSGQSVADPGLQLFIKRKMNEFNIAPQQLWFELTETAAIKQFAVAKEFMENMRKMGCKVALDDFGSGLSSFGYLKNLPIDVLKIDGQFVKDLATNAIDQEMVRSFDNIGKAMGITTVAEFVESAEIVEVLQAIGVDYAQGYYIGKPCKIEDALNSIDDWKSVA